MKGFTLVELAIAAVFGIIVLTFVVFAVQNANDPDFEKSYCEAQKYQAVADLPATCLKYYETRGM